MGLSLTSTSRGVGIKHININITIKININPLRRRRHALHHPLFLLLFLFFFCFITLLLLIIITGVLWWCGGLVCPDCVCDKILLPWENFAQTYGETLPLLQKSALDGSCRMPNLQKHFVLWTSLSSQTLQMASGVLQAENIVCDTTP